MTTLETDRLRLRRFTTEDAATLAELHGDPRVMRYIDDGRPVARELTMGRVLPEILDQYACLPEGLGKSAVVEKSSDRFIGWVGLGPVSSVGLAAGAGFELGYRLHAEFWRRGYASEAAKALVDHAFGGHAVPRIVATTMGGESRFAQGAGDCRLTLRAHVFRAVARVHRGRRARRRRVCPQPRELAGVPLRLKRSPPISRPYDKCQIKQWCPRALHAGAPLFV